MKSIKVKIIACFLLLSIVVTGGAGLTNTKKVQAASTGYSGKIWKISKVSLRTSKSTKAKALCKISKGKKVTVYYKSGNWRRVSYNGKTGWVLKKYVYISTSAPKLKGTTYQKGQTVASFAQRFIGNSYVWGGTNLNSGADCSGFTNSVYKAFGYNLPRTSSAQRSAGKKVSSKNIQPGDLVCYSGHIAIYIGNGKIVHASSAKTGIKISDNYKYRSIVTIRRIVK